MIVLLVNTESPAWLAEMKVGDILLEIDGQPINRIQDYYRMMDGRKNTTVLFKISRKGQIYELEV